MASVLLLVPARTYRATDFVAIPAGWDLMWWSAATGLALDRRLVVRVDPGDLEASVDRLLARSGPVDAVVAVDTPMLVLAAAVAARMGLTRNRVEAVRAAADKAASDAGGRPLAWPSRHFGSCPLTPDRRPQEGGGTGGVPLCGQGGVAERQPGCCEPTTSEGGRHVGADPAGPGRRRTAGG